MPVNAAASLDTLKRFLKPTIGGPAVGGGAGSVDTADVLNLGARRRDEEDQIAHNLDVQQELRQPEFTKSGVIGTSGATPSDLSAVRRDLAEDPFTGDDAMAQNQNIEHSLSNAALTMRPEIGDATKVTSQRNAFGDFLKKQAGYKADISPEGTSALDAESKRKVAENMSVITGRADAASAAKGLSAEGTKSATALHQAFNLGQTLHKLLTDKLKANPELARDSGEVPQLIDSAVARSKRWLYSQGVLQAPEGYDEATQLADWMKVLATRGLLGGVRNIEWINQIQDHLAQGRLPPAASLARLDVFLREAPGLEKEIYDVEKGHELLPGSPGAPGGQAAPGAGAPPVVLPQQPGLGDLYSRYQKRQQPAQ